MSRPTISLNYTVRLDGTVLDEGVYETPDLVPSRAATAYAESQLLDYLRASMEAFLSSDRRGGVIIASVVKADTMHEWTMDWDDAAAGPDESIMEEQPAVDEPNLKWADNEFDEV